MTQLSESFVDTWQSLQTRVVPQVGVPVPWQEEPVEPHCLVEALYVAEPRKLSYSTWR